MTQLRMIFAIVLATLSNVGLTLAQRDTVFPVNGKPVRGTVSSVTAKEVVLEERDTQKKFPAHRINYIAYGGEPSALKQAREAIQDGQFESAWELLQRIDVESIRREEIRQDLEFYLAYCRSMLVGQDGMTAAAAEKTFLAFVRKQRNSYHYFETAELLGRLAMKAGDYAKAAKYFASYARAPWPEVKVKATVLEAGALRAQGPEKCELAKKQYESVLRAELSGADADRQRQMALAGLAACDAELGAADKGVSVVEEIIAKNDPADSELFAQSYLALGTCYRKLNKPQDAILAYLHVDLLFYTSRTAHAEALHYLGELWNAMGKAERALDARNRLKSEYPGTVWARR